MPFDPVLGRFVCPRRDAFTTPEALPGTVAPSPLIFNQATRFHARYQLSPFFTPTSIPDALQFIFKVVVGALKLNNAVPQAKTGVLQLVQIILQSLNASQESRWVHSTSKLEDMGPPAAAAKQSGTSTLLTHMLYSTCSKLHPASSGNPYDVMRLPLPAYLSVLCAFQEAYPFEGKGSRLAGLRLNILPSSEFA